MNIGLLILSIILFLIVVVLVLRMHFLHKSLKEIETVFSHILKSDTNALITTSSSSKVIKDFVICLNKELGELRTQRMQYQNGNQELKRAITNISHDLRTPLTAITGYIDLMKQEALSPTQEQYLNRMDAKSNELIELTEQLFDFSKTMDIVGELPKEECCINEILEETLISYYTLFKEKQIIPEIQLCEEKVYKLLNKSSCIRIFENILSNVVKYSDGNFKVVLQNDGTILFSNKATSLDATSVQKIFDRYFTVENAKKATGLGLSIAKQLIEVNGGSISANYKNGILEIKMRF